MARQTGGELAALLRSIRRWLLVLVVVFGALLVTLSAVGYEVSGATDGALYATTGLVGALIALVASMRVFGTLVLSTTFDQGSARGEER